MSMLNSVYNALTRKATTPIPTPRSVRMATARGITSMPAGKMVPIYATGILREDSIRSGRLRFNFESMETAELLLNPINVRVMAYFVPMLALERMNKSMDVLNRSWEGQPAYPGQPIVPWVELERFDVGAVGGGQPNKPGKACPIYRYLGLHGRDAQMVNTIYKEAYNAIWNLRAKNRTDKLALRTRLQSDLAPAFWYHQPLKHIVTDFDQAKVDGQVALNVVNSKMPIRGIGVPMGRTSWGNGAPVTVREPGGFTNGWGYGYHSDTPAQSFDIRTTSANGFPDVYAELAQNGITVSLSNIELAKKTQAFAKLRERYNGHSDEWIINMLMDGISIPEMAFTQPMLVGEKHTIFGLAKRYASDGANLTESVTNGATFVDMAITLPRVNMGGLLMVVAEILPDQMYERMKDPFFHAQTQDSFPHFLRDELDPEKVEAVPNEYVDIDHATPAATFGYAPLNYAWNIVQPRIGGKFYRPDVDSGFDEDRQRFWVCETANPKLSEDFFIATNIHQKPFVVTNQDPFEVVIEGDLLIEGNTVFGATLYEASNDYAKVLAEAPQGRLVKAP